jgi:hypothetical protein
MLFVVASSVITDRRRTLQENVEDHEGNASMELAKALRALDATDPHVFELEAQIVEALSHCKAGLHNI